MLSDFTTRMKLTKYRVIIPLKRLSHYTLSPQSSFDYTWGKPRSRWTILKLYAIAILFFALCYLSAGDWSVDDDTRSLSWFESIYFSIVTITTLGYGEIHPKTAPQMLLVSLEVIIGIITFGYLFHWLGQEWSDKQQQQFLKQQQATRDVKLVPLFKAIIKITDSVTGFFNCRDPRDYSHHHNFLLDFGGDTVSMDQSYFQPNAFVKQLKDNKKLPLANLKSWQDTVAYSLIGLEVALVEAPDTPTEPKLLEHIRDFKKLGADIDQSLESAPTVLNEKEVIHWASRIELFLKEAHSFKQFIASKADASWSVSDKSRGYMEHNRLQRKHQLYEPVTTENMGRKLALKYLTLKKNIKDRFTRI